MQVLFRSVEEQMDSRYYLEVEMVGLMDMLNLGERCQIVTKITPGLER